MRLQQYLNEGYSTRNLLSQISSDWISKKKLPVGTKNKINSAISKILKPTYFKSIPLDPIFKAMEKHGVVPIQEDNTYWSGLLIGGVDKTEMVHFNLGWKDEMGDVMGKPAYKAIPNAVFTMTYYKMPSGKYEVIGYIG